MAIDYISLSLRLSKYIDTDMIVLPNMRLVRCIWIDRSSRFSVWYHIFQVQDGTIHTKPITMRMSYGTVRLLYHYRIRTTSSFLARAIAPILVIADKYTLGIRMYFLLPEIYFVSHSITFVDMSIYRNDPPPLLSYLLRLYFYTQKLSFFLVHEHRVRHL